MGVIHKIKLEVVDFILKSKDKNRNYSCRKLASLATEKFAIKISKSSINSLIKKSGLSMPVGRRRKVRRGIIEAEGLGVILLKAVDILIGGSSSISLAITKRLGVEDNENIAKTDKLIYRPLFNIAKGPAGEAFKAVPWPIAERQFPASEIDAYLKSLQESPGMVLEIKHQIAQLFQEVRCLRFDLVSGNNFFLDGQLHSIWSTAHTPYDFSAPLPKIRSYIERYFLKGQTFILSFSQGYDTPNREFFDFISSLKGEGNGVNRVILYGNKLEELESINLAQNKKYSFILGLWPWQYEHYRKVKKLKDFFPFYSRALKQRVYLAQTEIGLTFPSLNKEVLLRGCSLKLSPNRNINILILSNIDELELKINEIADLYLEHWPNLEEGFQDFSRKIELFTYTSGSRRFFALEDMPRQDQSPNKIESVLTDYLKALDLYARWHFFPLGYEDRGFSLCAERFYNLGGNLRKQKNQLVATFHPPAGYLFLKDLQYACRRINEKEVFLSGSQKLSCKVA
jgi:hypothetical protein